jgi:hypothetical protein
VRAPCVAILDPAKELLEFGVVNEAAQSLVDLRRCAQEPGCEDWRNCSCQIDGTWREGTHPTPAPNPEAVRRERG